MKIISKSGESGINENENEMAKKIISNEERKLAKEIMKMKTQRRKLA
jgi:hypothetical protein